MRAEPCLTIQGTPLSGCLLLTPQVLVDARGFFFESWNQQGFDAVLHSHGQQPARFVQDNHSGSSRGVLRGLHYQLAPEVQGKLVRCVVGEIYDVAVDLRRASPSFAQWSAVLLSATNRRQLWLPAGFAHGFLALSNHAEVAYKTTRHWSQACERAIRWDDPQLAVTWPLDRLAGASPLLADRDRAAPSLAEAVAAGEVLA